MNAGPQPGDRILLVSAKDDKEVTDLLSLIFGHFQLRITVASTGAEGVGTLNQPFDLVWLHLPLPDLSSNYLLEELLATPDLVGRVGSESPADVLDRLTSINWYTKLSQRVLKDDLNEAYLQERRSIVNLAKPVHRKQSGPWLWIRIRTDEECAWVMQLLEQSISK